MIRVRRSKSSIVVALSVFLIPQPSEAAVNVLKYEDVYAKSLMIVDHNIVDRIMLDPTMVVDSSMMANLPEENRRSVGTLFRSMAGNKVNANDFAAAVTGLAGASAFDGRSYSGLQFLSRLLRTWRPNGENSHTFEELPLRPLAIVNRFDRAELCTTAQGTTGYKDAELRFSFGAQERTSDEEHGWHQLPIFMTIELRAGCIAAPRVAQAAAQWLDLTKKHGEDAVTATAMAVDGFLELDLADVRVRFLGNSSTNAAWQFGELSLGKGGIFVRENLEGLVGNGGNNAGAKTASGETIESGDAEKEFKSFLKANAESLSGDMPKYRVPEALQMLGVWFMADTVLTLPLDAGNEKVRHGFALSQCTGCHGAETGTDFFHISNREQLTDSRLSAFLRGSTVSPKCGGCSTYSYQTLQSRADGLAKLAGPGKYQLVGESGASSSNITRILRFRAPH